MYNAHHRQGKPSQYTWENVAIVPGGRAGLIRIAAILNQAYLGFFIPDYTAYNEMLSLFRNVSWTLMLMCSILCRSPRDLSEKAKRRTVADGNICTISSPLSQFLYTRTMVTTSTLTRSPRKLHEVPV